MKKLGLTLLAWIPCLAFCQTSSISLDWMEFFPPSDTKIQSMAVDHEGHVYATGFIYPNGELYGHQRTSTRHESFIVKLDSLGNVFWVQVYASDGFISNNRIMEGADHNLYYFADIQTAITTPYGSNVIPPRFRTEVIFKLDSSGKPIWNQFTGQTGSSDLNRHTIDPSGNLYVHCTIEDTWYLTLDSSLSISPEGENNRMIGKIDEHGTWEWAQLIPGVEQIQELKTDQAGQLLITGVFKDTLFLGDTVFYPRGGTDLDAFFSLLDSDGNFLINKRAGWNWHNHTSPQHRLQDHSILVWLGHHDAFYYDNKPLGGHPWGSFLRLNADLSFLSVHQPFDMHTELISIRESKHGELWCLSDFTSGMLMGDDTLKKVQGEASLVLFKLNQSLQYQQHTIISSTGNLNPAKLDLINGESPLLLIGSSKQIRLKNKTLGDTVISATWNTALIKFNDLSIPTRVPEISKNPVYLYPNPTNNSFRINMLNRTQPDEVTLLDLNGRRIKTWQAEREYLLPELPAGLYLVLIRCGEEVSAKRLVIQGR